MGTLLGIGLVLLIIVLAVVSMLDEPSKRKVKGKVLEKHFVPAHDEQLMPPYSFHHNDDWYLVVEVKDGKTEKCLVPRDVYDKVQVGEFIDLT